MTVTWSPLSLLQHEEVLNALIAYSPRAAERFSDRIVAVSERLVLFPRSGRQVPEFGDDRLREVIVGRYRLWYRLSGNEIDMVTIWPAALPVEDV